MPWQMTQNSCTRGLGIVGIVGSRCMARPLDDGDDFRAIHSNRSMCDVVFSFAANGLRFTVRGQSWKLKVPLVIFYWWTLGQTACMHLLRYMAGHGALWHIHLNGYIIYIYRINCSRGRRLLSWNFKKFLDYFSPHNAVAISYWTIEATWANIFHSRVAN